MIFYKVCAIRDGRFFSYSAPGKYELEYTIGKVTMPAEGTTWVSAWKSLAKTRHWRRNSTVVLRCEGELAGDQDPPMVPPLFDSDIDTLWAGKGPAGDRLSLPGAVYLKSIKPIAIVPVVDRKDGAV